MAVFLFDFLGFFLVSSVEVRRRERERRHFAKEFFHPCSCVSYGLDSLPEARGHEAPPGTHVDSARAEEQRRRRRRRRRGMRRRRRRLEHANASPAPRPSRSGHQQRESQKKQQQQRRRGTYREPSPPRSGDERGHLGGAEGRSRASASGPLLLRERRRTREKERAQSDSLKKLLLAACLPLFFFLLFFTLAKKKKKKHGSPGRRRCCCCCRAPLRRSATLLFGSGELLLVLLTERRERERERERKTKSESADEVTNGQKQVRERTTNIPESAPSRPSLGSVASPVHALDGGPCSHLSGTRGKRSSLPRYGSGRQLDNASIESFGAARRRA